MLQFLSGSLLKTYLKYLLTYYVVIQSFPFLKNIIQTDFTCKGKIKWRQPYITKEKKLILSPKTKREILGARPECVQWSCWYICSALYMTFQDAVQYFVESNPSLYLQVHAEDKCVCIPLPRKEPVCIPFSSQSICSVFQSKTIAHLTQTSWLSVPTV